MKKSDLRNGDLIVNAEGDLGVVIVDLERIFYQNNGSEFLDSFDEDLTLVERFYDSTIMQVYRDLDFYEVENEDGNPIYERDCKWRRPTKEEMEENDRIREEKKKAFYRELESRTMKQSDSIEILVQGFYGNRTATEIRKDNFDSFMLGYLDKTLCKEEEIDRTIVKIPNTDNIVVVYNKYQETRKYELMKKHTDYVPKPVVSIPELDLEIYSRCIFCKMDEDRELDSLRNFCRCSIQEENYDIL